MRMERIRPAVLRITLHAYELSALIAAARWAAEGGEGALDTDARAQLRQVLAGYDQEAKRMARQPQSAQREN